MHLVGMFPADGCGIGDDPDCTMPTNAPIALRFDRFLNPVSATRQAIRVYPGNPALGPPFTYDVVYDPVERVVEYRVPPGASYKPGTVYEAELLVADAPNDPGIRAVDGAPLGRADLPLRVSFRTADAPVELEAPPAPPSCADVVQQVFGKLGQCAGQECHRRGDNALLGSGDELGDAPHQLWLDSPGRFALSAISRVARQTDLGDFSGGPSTPQSPRFGVRMALIEPGSPGGSYLMYKLFLDPRNFEPCPPDAAALCAGAVDPPASSHAFLPLASGESLAPAPEELERLREWFVRGEPMPRSNSLGVRGNVQLEGLRALGAFIDVGAPCAP